VATPPPILRGSFWALEDHRGCVRAGEEGVELRASLQPLSIR
jgi:hypothetical protein